MTLGIAFEGCACRSAWQVGVAEWLVARGVRLSVAAGASSGALVAAAVALGEVPRMREVWLDVTTRYQPYDRSALRRGRWPGRMSHVLRAGLAPMVGELRLAQVPGPLAIAVTELGLFGPRPRMLTQADPYTLMDAILASCFLPGPYSRLPVLGGRPMVDGAWRHRVPVDALGPLGATRRLALTTHPRGLRVGGLLRRRTLAWPDEVRVLAPDGELPIRGFDFDPPRTLQAMAQGHQDAAAFARAHEAWLAG